MKNKITHILLFSLIFLIAESLEARTFRVIYLNAPANAPKSAYIYDGKKSQKVDLPGMNFSKIYRLRAGDVALQLLPKKIMDKSKIPTTAPQVVVPKAVTDCYLLMRSNSDDPSMPISMELVDASFNKFKNGDTMWVNLTENNVEGRTGSDIFKLTAFGKVILKAPAKDREAFPVYAAYCKPDEERKRLLVESSWKQNSDVRNLVFVYTIRKKRAPRVLGFADIREK